MPPLTQGAIRSALATLMVLGVMRLRGLPIAARDGSLAAALIAGALFGIEFMLIYRGLLYTTATRAVLFIYLAPFFVVLGARCVLPGDRFASMQWLGLLMAFAGMVVAFGVPAPASSPRSAARRPDDGGGRARPGPRPRWSSRRARCRACRRKRRCSISSWFACRSWRSARLLFGERIAAMPSAVALGSLAYQTIVVGSHLQRVVRADREISASRLSAFTFLTPLFGVAAGHLVLGEPLTPAFAVAVLLVAAGLILVNRPR